VDSINERPDARKVICDVLEVDTISTYQIRLPYGLCEENDPVEVSRLLATRKVPTEIIYYDSLLDQLISAYFRARVDSVSRNGWCSVYHIVFPNIQSNTKAFISESGSSRGDKLSVFFEADDLIFECIEITGESHRLSASVVGNDPHYIRFEFSNDENGMYMSLNVDNVEHDLRVGKRPFNFELDATGYVLGADLDGKNGACFQILESYALCKTMEIKAKLGSFMYFSQRIKSTTRCIEFAAESFMRRSPKGDMTQEIEELKPRLKDQFGYK
jgi:hypothetical protein